MHTQHTQDLPYVSQYSLKRFTDFMHQCDLMAALLCAAGWGISPASGPCWKPQTYNYRILPWSLFLNVPCKTSEVCNNNCCPTCSECPFLCFSVLLQSAHGPVNSLQPHLRTEQLKREEYEKLLKILYLHHIRLSKFTLNMITNVKYYSQLCVDFSVLRL